MGVLDAFTQLMASRTPGQVSGSFQGLPVVATNFGADIDTSLVEHATPAQMWRSQPHLRTVVDFQARQVAKLGLHLYKRDGTTHMAERLRTGPVAETLLLANPAETFYDLMESLVRHLALYDKAFLVVLPWPERDRFQLRVFPSPWVSAVWRDSFTIDHYELTAVQGSGSSTVKLDAEKVIPFLGWSPDDPTRSTSPVETLRLMLEEQYAARIYRKQQWSKQGRFGGFFTRPADAPSWDDNARRRFRRMVNAFQGNRGPRAGEPMLLEDGTTYTPTQVSGKESQWLESTKASLEMCAQVYQINPTMVGQMDNANYSNVREFRRALYGDTLGPILRRIEQRFTHFVLPALGAEAGLFVEFNVEAQLRGSFEEQAAVVSTATGAPWQTRNEARAIFNMAPVDGGDELITPLNVIAGGQASPQDGGAITGDKARAVLERFYARQCKSVTSKRAAGGSWWDRERWDRELEADLVKAGVPEQEAFIVALRFNDAAHAAFVAESPLVDVLEVVS